MTATADADVADLARLLHGTWVRRLTIGGALLETNSFLYFDMSGPEPGLGEALMIDRINQGWDALASSSGDLHVDHGHEPLSETAATTGAYWQVSMKRWPPDAAGEGFSGVALALSGDYRGTGEEYPPNGLRFTESGTFYRAGPDYTTLHPWRAPPMTAGSADSADESERFTPVDAVVVRTGVDERARPTLTFIMCQDGIVDRYYKISNATPTVRGKSLKDAWRSDLISGTFLAEMYR
ncbi:MAG: hypothetical protein P8Y58_05915 [Novosphingobium sp.]